MSPPSPPPHPRTPWYREPYVWLPNSIPAAAMPAGLITVALAIAADDTAPDGAPAQSPTSSRESS